MTKPIYLVYNKRDPHLNSSVVFNFKDNATKYIEDISQKEPGNSQFHMIEVPLRTCSSSKLCTAYAVLDYTGFLKHTIVTNSTLYKESKIAGFFECKQDALSLGRSYYQAD